MSSQIVAILMERSEYTRQEAEEALDDARLDLDERMWNPEEFGCVDDIMMDWFGLEDDFINELY